MPIDRDDLSWLPTPKKKEEVGSAHPTEEKQTRVPAPKNKGGRPKGWRFKTPADVVGDVRNGELMCTDGKGEVLARLSMSDLAQEILKEFDGYAGIAKAIRFVYETTENWNTKLKSMQLATSIVRQGALHAPAEMGLAGMNEKQLEKVFHERVELLRKEGLLDMVMAKVGGQMGFGEVFEVGVAEERVENLEE